MEVKFIKADFEETLDNIMELLNMKDNEYFIESIFEYYPNIKKEEILNLSNNEIRDYLSIKLKDIEKEKHNEIDEKIKSYQKYWDENKAKIIIKFEEIFNIDLSNEFNNIRGRVGLNPICPRFLETNEFDIFYLYSEKGAIVTAIHEIVHFIWFKIWNEIYKDEKREYESPHLKWIFSEIAISPILLDERFKDIIYLEKPAYEYFYSIEVENKNFIDMINEIYKENSIKDFMIKGFELCRKYESEIREAMY